MGLSLLLVTLLWGTTYTLCLSPSEWVTPRAWKPGAVGETVCRWGILCVSVKVNSWDRAVLSSRNQSLWCYRAASLWFIFHCQHLDTSDGYGLSLHCWTHSSVWVCLTFPCWMSYLVLVRRDWPVESYADRSWCPEQMYGPCLYCGGITWVIVSVNHQYLES